ncbi:MAG: CBS domain-containing protein [Rhodospirillales bacterium]|nr:CBS domain-containing protein [Rhodospirillales bacterium]
MIRKIVPDVISGVQDLATASAHMTVRDAAQVMAQRRIGALMVIDGPRLAGIFTERDLLSKVVAQRRDPDTVHLGDVMTRDPDTIGPEESAFAALEMMRSRGYRHLPVMDRGRLIGMVSVRDLYATALDEVEEGLKERDAFISGSAGYGLT